MKEEKQRQAYLFLKSFNNVYGQVRLKDLETNVVEYGGGDVL